MPCKQSHLSRQHSIGLQDMLGIQCYRDCPKNKTKQNKTKQNKKKANNY